MNIKTYVILEGWWRNRLDEWKFKRKGGSQPQRPKDKVKNEIGGGDKSSQR